MYIGTVLYNTQIHGTIKIKNRHSSIYTAYILYIYLSNENKSLVSPQLE